MWRIKIRALGLVYDRSLRAYQVTQALSAGLSHSRRHMIIMSGGGFKAAQHAWHSKGKEASPRTLPFSGDFHEYRISYKLRVKLWFFQLLYIFKTEFCTSRTGGLKPKMAVQQFLESGNESGMSILM